MLHVAVEVVQVLVLEELVVRQVKLAPAVVVALLVPDTRKVQPLRVTKLVACIGRGRLER